MAHEQPATGRQLDQLGDAARLQRRDRDQCRLSLDGLRHRRKVGELTEHRQPADSAEVQVVVEERDRPQAVRGHGLQRPDQLAPCIAGAEHQRR